MLVQGRMHSPLEGLVYAGSESSVRVDSSSFGTVQLGSVTLKVHLSFGTGLLAHLHSV